MVFGLLKMKPGKFVFLLSLTDLLNDAIDFEWLLSALPVKI